MKVGIVGLGKMGRQIVEKLISDNHEVHVLDKNREAIDYSVSLGAVEASDRSSMIGMLGDKPIVWLMIPADFVQDEVEEFVQILPEGSVLIDGGNSHFRGSIDRATYCATKKINFIDVGTSGGVLGTQQGFSMMIGGDKNTYELIEPMLSTLAKPAANFGYMGPSGSGHYVKMIHNGIEYALMQSYAEGYDLLKYGAIKDLNLAEIARVWQGGSIIESSLNGLVKEILSENPELEGIDGYVADSGEGRWTYETAESVSVPMPALREALAVRISSQGGYSTFATRLLSAMRNKFGGHALNK